MRTFKLNDKQIVILMVISVFLFLLLARTLNSGFHFVDDHEVIKIKNELKSSSLTDVTLNWVKVDLKTNTRFRPLYYVHRVFETKILGSDFLLWSLYTTILCCLTLISFYMGMRNFKFTIGESVVFLIIGFLGQQSSVWWRLGPGESLGVFFLGIALYFMSTCLTNNKYLLKTFLFVVFLILASLTKESFLIIIPGMIFFKVWYEKSYIWSSLRETVNRNLILIFPLLIMFIELLIIKFYVGTGYSGLDSNILSNIPAILLTSMQLAKTYLNLLVAGIVIFIASIIIKKSFLKLNAFAICFFLLLTIPNIILYAKSGLVERYLLPASLGVAFLTVASIRGIEDNPEWFKKLALTLTIIAFLPNLVMTFNDAKRFSREGFATGRLLTAISTKAIKDQPVMVVVNPADSYEYSVSLKTYLLYENQIDLYGFSLTPAEISDDDKGLVDGWKSYFTGKQYENLESKPGLLIFLDKKKVEEFFKTSTLIQSDYTSIEIGNSYFALFEKRN